MQEVTDRYAGSGAATIPLGRAMTARADDAPSEIRAVTARCRGGVMRAVTGLHAGSGAGAIPVGIAVPARADDVLSENRANRAVQAGCKGEV
ncbi:MAG: hypothetical protein AAFR17_03170 [Pseudomonadota bacterium]